jgi:hypothetical protein
MYKNSINGKEDFSFYDVYSICFWFFLERVKGIEPSYSAWEAAALPLSYTRDLI